MKLLFANIGGSSGYANVMTWLENSVTSNLPCIFMANECGDNDMERNLAPFFSHEKKNKRVCIHDCDKNRSEMMNIFKKVEGVYTKIKYKVCNKAKSPHVN